MLHLNYFIVANSASIDVYSNRLSLFFITEILQPLRLPREVPELVGVCSWVATDPEDSKRDYQALIRTYPPGESNYTNSDPINFDFREHGRSRLRFRLAKLSVKQPGELRFELLLNAEVVAKYLVEVTPPLDV